MKNSFLFSFLILVFAAQLSAQSTKMITHRGAFQNTGHPENSIASLKAAAEQGAWGSEFDVHLTKDDELVVNHDPNFYGIDIATSTYDELLAKKHPNGENIPTAEEYLKEGKKHKKMKLIYELKTNKLGVDRTLEAARKSVALVKKLKLRKQVEYIAFSWEACLEIKKLDKKAKVHYLSGDKSPQEIKDAGLDGLDYHFKVYKDNPTWIKESKDLKLKTNVWTVNSKEDMEYFIGEGIDYITTNEPELLNTLLGK